MGNRPQGSVIEMGYTPKRALTYYLVSIVLLISDRLPLCQQFFTRTPPPPHITGQVVFTMGQDGLESQCRQQLVPGTGWSDIFHCPYPTFYTIHLPNFIQLYFPMISYYQCNKKMGGGQIQLMYIFSAGHSQILNLYRCKYFQLQG